MDYNPLTELGNHADISKYIYKGMEEEKAPLHSGMPTRTFRWSNGSRKFPLVMITVRLIHTVFINGY